MNRSAQVAMQPASGYSDPRIDSYLGRLENLLRDMTPEEKEDTLREIRMHILDSTAGAADPDAAVDQVLRMLGTPEELGARYGTERMLARAARSFSPWLLLRTCWRWAMMGVKGVFAFLLAILGYGTALALTVSVFLKPFMPSQVGMWLGHGKLVVGMADQHPGTHELLGQWFVPVMAVVACAIAVGTTHALRWMIRKRTPSLGRSQYPASLAGSVQV